MTDVLVRMLCGATLGLALVLLLRRAARRAFGAGPAFTLWLLAIALMLAPLLPQELAPAAMVMLPGLTVTPHVTTAVSASAMDIDWGRWLVMGWLVGVLVGLLRLGIQYSRLLQGLRAVPDAWMRMLGEAAPKLDVRRVRVHDAGPAVLWSLPRPLILLPADFPGRFENTAAYELVLRHELMHARRGDALWSLAMEIASALLWFHPLAWLARPRFRLDQELACDAASLRLSPQRSGSYARALLTSAAVPPRPALIPWLAEPQLKERIAMLTQIPPGALRRRAGFLAVVGLLTCGLLIAGGQTPVRAAAPGASAVTPPSVDVAFKNQNPPRYPVDALKKREQGVVMLKVKVDAAGTVQNVMVDDAATTAPTSLQNAAIAAARGWQFKAGEKAGKPVGGVVRIPVTFSLLDTPPAGKAPLVLRVHVDANGNVTDAVVDDASMTSVPKELQARAIAEVKSLKFNQPGPKMASGWYKVPFSFGPSTSSSAADAVEVTATPIH